MSATSRHRKEHERLRYPAVDANGNLLAEVTPRTGTMASLMAVQDAGNGEIATATDMNANVIYTGDSPSVGFPAPHSGYILNASQTFGGSLVTGDNIIPIDSAQKYPQLLVDDVNNEILVPTWVPRALGDAISVEFSIEGLFLGLDAGAVISATVERFFNSTWHDIFTGNQKTFGNLSATESGGATKIIGSSQSFISTVGDTSALRLVINSNSVGASTLSIDVALKLKYTSLQLTK